MRPTKDIRRHQRVPCTLPVLLAWTRVDGSDCYIRGKCRNISPVGLQIETTETIAAQSYVNLRVEKVDVVGSAKVRYFRRGAMRNIIGLELNQEVRQQLLDALRNQSRTNEGAR